MLHIKITSVITPYENGAPSAKERQMLHSTAKGSISVGDDGGVLSYTEESDGAVSETVIRFPASRDGLTLERTGAIESKIELFYGREHHSTYSLPPYSFPLSVTLSSLENTLSAEGGRLRLSYKMTLGGEEQSVSLLLLAEREVDL